MKKRVNNDVKLEWTILRNGVAEDFSDAINIKLYGIIPNAIKIEVPFTRVLNVFHIAIPANSLNIGKYDLVIVYQKPDASFVGGYGTHSVDRIAAFEVVRNSINEDDEGRTITDSVNYAVDGATFTPTVQKVDNNTIRLYWTNNKGLPNPNDIIFYSNMTYANGNLTINYGINS